jgi:hypothetical protein
MGRVRIMRRGIVSSSEDKREAVLNEIEAIGSAAITDVLSWDSSGNVTVKNSNDLPLHVQKSIKKVKVTPTKDGNAIEVEMHDKISALRLLSKHHGLLEVGSDDNKPSILGINIRGPQATTTYEIKHESPEKEITE